MGSELQDWISYYNALSKFIEIHDKERRFEFRGNLLSRFERLRDSLRRSFVLSEVGDELRVAKIWLRKFKKMMSEAREKLRAEGAEYPKELKSFISDPEAHLMKKITFYLYDLLREKMSTEEFIRTAGAAVRTSLKTNMRSLYQNWVYLAILSHLADMGGILIYPEVKVILLGRSGKQKTGTIPPNSIINLFGKGFLSFFLEAPRPISWEDSLDLKKIWTLYVTLRPDVLVYGGKVLNIVQLGSDPPIKRPDAIIECKELEDWYKRIRDVRGPFAKPLSVEEWRSKWINGLWEGLAEAMGVEKKKVIQDVKKKRSVRMKDFKIVMLYRSIFKPKKMFLISRKKVPDDIKSELESKDIVVYDDINFDKRRLKQVAEELYKLAKRGENDGDLIELDPYTSLLLEKLEAELGMNRKTLLRKIIEFAYTRKKELMA